MSPALTVAMETVQSKLHRSTEHNVLAPQWDGFHHGQVIEAAGAKGVGFGFCFVHCKVPKGSEDKAKHYAWSPIKLPFQISELIWIKSYGL